MTWRLPEAIIFSVNTIFFLAYTSASPVTEVKQKWPLFLLLAIMIMLFFFAWWLDSRRRKKEKEFLRNILAVKEKRDNKRLPLTAACSMHITLTDPESFGWRCQVIDLSASGLAVEPDFPLRRLPLQKPWNNVLLQTSWTNVVIRTIQPVRFEHQAGKRLLGLRITAIDDDQELLWLNLVESVKESGHDRY